MSAGDRNSREPDDWFLPKAFGYGASLPIAWQGWALLAAYVAALAGAGWALMPRHPILFVVVALLVTVPLVVVSEQHTRGGWRWRWGGK
ncbi:MAG: hypothetical protein J0I47_00700 [Sphingomonas sp.]|uniref:hypothetical protein n=1 Tax=Sphingomonas sp. TaxID=28214 RepID=UPI001ACBD47D|nr:hypothetical protein [Sphingomonas sp.]MBN8806748.1 hypothetical protein [Sphingomonas sp.]